MANEILFTVTALIDLAFMVFLSRFGRAGLVTGIVINLALVSTFGGKLIELFGLTTNAGNVFYASAFFAAAILTEHFGRRDGYVSVRVGFSALVLFVLMGQFVLRYVSIPDTAALSEAMRMLFEGVPRVAFASLAAYVVSQHLNVWLFDILHQDDGARRLWLRTILSASVGQVVDSILFFSIAFVGVLPAATLLETIYAGFLAKLAVALLSVPFIYLSYLLVEEGEISQPLGQIERETGAYPLRRRAVLVFTLFFMLPFIAIEVFVFLAYPQLGEEMLFAGALLLLFIIFLGYFLRRLRGGSLPSPYEDDGSL
ncbi:MAG: queuosine precursor transporter [bacterium]|nr:queuosine precursor transporter [bacterium]